MTRPRGFPGAVSGFVIALAGLVVCAAVIFFFTGAIFVIEKIGPVGLVVGFLSVFVGFLVLLFAAVTGLQLSPLCRISTLIVSVVSSTVPAAFTDANSIKDIGDLMLLLLSILPVQVSAPFVFVCASADGRFVATVSVLAAIIFKSALVGIVASVATVAVSGIVVYICYLDLIKKVIADIRNHGLPKILGWHTNHFVTLTISTVLGTGLTYIINEYYKLLTNITVQIFAAALFGALAGDVIARLYAIVADSGHTSPDEDIGADNSDNDNSDARATGTGGRSAGSGVSQSQIELGAVGHTDGSASEPQENTRQIETSVHDVPTIKDLMGKVAVHLSDEWQQLAIQLNLNQDSVRRIELNNPRNTLGCCRDTFSEWLRKELDPSWDKIIEALKTQSVDQPRLARDLEEQYTCRQIIIDV